MNKVIQRSDIMKKLATLLLAFVLVLTTVVGCGKKDAKDDSNKQNPVQDQTTDTTDDQTDNQTTPDTPVDPDAKSEGVMTYAEYVAAAIDDAVVIEAYVQAKQSWWEDKATVYAQDKDGAYFLYNMACSEEDYAKLVPGTKIKVSGYKAEWAGEIEIIDSTFEIEEGSYIAPALDITDKLGSDDLINYQNQFVSFKGMTVEARDDGSAFNYKWDGSGVDGDDLYFNVSLNGTTYTFTVESYLCDSTTDVYAAVKALEVGQTVDLEGFLYWYEGVNPHITSVTVK